LAKSLEELKDGFADLWASLGNVSFDLTWHNLSGCVTPPFDQDAREVIGNLALPFTWPPDESEFTLGCDVLTLPKDEKFEEARSAFKDLSSEAGRRLPAIDASLQLYVGQLNDDPAAWWYAMLFREHEKHVAYQQGNEIEYHKSLSIWQPVKDSVQAIGVLITRETAATVDEQPPVPARKICSFKQGEAQEKWISGLADHHKIDHPTDPINSTPVILNEFARTYSISSGSASKYFREFFGNHRTYEILCQKDPQSLVKKIRNLIEPKPLREGYLPGEIVESHQTAEDEYHGSRPDDVQ